MASIESYEIGKGLRYMVRYRKPDGKLTKKRGFRRKTDALKWGTEKESSKLHGEFIDESKGAATVEALSIPWLAKKKVTVKPSTFNPLETSLRVHVLPRWGSVQVKKVSHGEVQTWVSELSSIRGATVVIRAYGILAGILDDAVADRRLSRNPARKVDLPKKPHRTHIYLTVDQLLALSNAMMEKPRKGPLDAQRSTLILLLGTCGLRWGEAVGLHVSDVDVKKHRIRVERSATELSNGIVEGTPKNGKGRTVIYPDMLDDRLRGLMENRDRNDLLFVNSTGGHMRRDSAAQDGKWFRAACERAGVPRMTLHDLRHTAASLMVHSGANVKAVQRQLGHSSAAMTLDVYADLFDDDLDAVRVSMNEILLMSVPKMCPLGLNEVA